MNTPELYRLLGRVLGDRDHLLMLGMQEAADGAIFSAQKPQGNVGSAQSGPKFLLLNERLQKGACLVRGFIFGDDQWRTGWVIGSRQVKLAVRVSLSGLAVSGIDYSTEPSNHDVVHGRVRRRRQAPHS